MRVHIVSDVHGAGEDLRTAALGADVFICLGDLLLYLDYDDPTQGAFADVFGPDTTREYIALRTQRRFEQARRLVETAWVARYGPHDDRRSVMMSLVRAQYEALLPQLPSGTLLTFGNVDVPWVAAPFVPEGVHVVDGEVVEVGPARFGFVGGGLRSVYRTPNELTSEEYDRKVRTLGPVDVLCSHIPPLVPDLLFDRVARRFEVGSGALTEYIREHQPRYAVFGHVHNPLARRFRLGRTECLNVGHFRGTREPFRLELAD